MFKRILAGAVCAGAMVCAGQAAAVTFSMTGTITSGSGSDGIIHVGDVITLTAHAPDDLIAATAGGSFVGTYPGGLSITLDGYNWRAVDDELDQWDHPYCVNFKCSSGPLIFFSGDKITGVTAGDPLLKTFSSVPALLLSGDGFSIFDSTDYGNTSAPQHFLGSWDLASSIVSVPEPASWAMMLLGFFGLGAILRRRRAVAA